jgi:16S rRNA (guanine527-N7)-methyltransferase
MTEDEAQHWLRDRLDVSRETFDQLDAFRHMVVEEAVHQNLISASTLDHIWARHIVDSAQLLLLAVGTGAWLDLGTGAGFPGMIVAILTEHPVLLVESRRKRIDFLAACCDRLALGSAVELHGMRIESLATRSVDVISARAFAPLPKLFASAHRFSHPGTKWVLPKGRSAREELESAQQSWQGVFHVEQSVTDNDAAILIAHNVARRKIK